ncbi:MAG TPA: hypothetical protein VKB52_08300, partial [Rhodanobacteraceae bacterium]|nr:hypothetical protein [Rhodanobacteraceae bacterium]
MNCEDNGTTGTLRDIIGMAQSGDTVDLSGLPVACGVKEAKVTLGDELSVEQNDLTLIGPDPSDGHVTISGNNHSRVFNHRG